MKSFTAEGIKDFDLEHIFECGQCFRWEKNSDGTYDGIAKGRIVNVRYDTGLENTAAQPSGPAKTSDDTQVPGNTQVSDNTQTPDASQKSDSAKTTDASQASSTLHDAGGRLTITPCTEKEFEEIWRPYFDLDRDYSKIKKTLSADDEVMQKATEYGYGIRLLQQDLWETIVSFIISQNNNIPRIKGCIERLCDNFGEPIASPGEMHGTSSDEAHDIPSPEKLAALTIEDLAPVRLGYRAKYIIETARTVCEEGLPEDFDQLSELCGVGPKVANCISLFGMQDYTSFPIDVWVIKVMHELYGLPEKDKKGMAEFAREKFGDLGGFAQQYLFYYMRDRS